MDKKRIKKKVKKRKISIRKITKLLVILTIINTIILLSLKIPIKNIYIINNNIISDKEIIDLSELSDYPPFILTNKKNIRKKLLLNDFIKDVVVIKEKNLKVKIDIKEYKIICLDKNVNKLYLENGKKVDNKYEISDRPILVSDISGIYDDFIKKFSSVDEEILLKISEIEYLPIDVDKERFLLRMNDGNYVYITLSKIKKINKYNEIYDKLEGKKGIIYLDSGNYIEVKE